MEDLRSLTNSSQELQIGQDPEELTQEETESIPAQAEADSEYLIPKVEFCPLVGEIMKKYSSKNGVDRITPEALNALNESVVAFMSMFFEEANAVATSRKMSQTYTQPKSMIDGSDDEVTVTNFEIDVIKLRRSLTAPEEPATLQFWPRNLQESLNSN